MSPRHRRVSQSVPVFIAWIAAAVFSTAWQPGPADPWAVGGFVVDRSDRRDVLAFYQRVYQASGGYTAHHGWAGSADACAEGSTSDVFREDVLRRINFVRALTGLPADIRFDAAKSAKAQKAALMMSKAGALSHFPGLSWPCHTADGASAAAAGNLALGNYGPAALDSYMRDDGDGNRPVGHRRWILHSRANVMGTGDIPAHGAYPAANALWVIGDFKPAPAPSFHAWPGEGYFPLPLLPARWSLSYPGADFSGATVAMEAGGVAVPLTVVSRTDNGMGDNTLVWEPSLPPPPAGGDVSLTVTVAGIAGSGPGGRIYTVTLFDPDVLGEAVVISGPARLPVTGQAYSFHSIEQVDQYELEVAALDGSVWTEGAEDSPPPRIMPSTSPGYPMRQTSLARSGSKAFHLTYPSGVFSDQSFLVLRDVLPVEGSRLRFHDRARFTAETTTLEAQVSSDSGKNWTTVFSRTGVGGNSGLWDATWAERDIGLSAYAGKVIRVRFLMKRNEGAVFQGVTDSYGFFMDDITITGASQLAGSHATLLPEDACSFVLGETTAGVPLQAVTTYALRIRPKVGLHWFESGPVRLVTTLPPDQLPDIAVFLSTGAELEDGASGLAFGRVMVGAQATMHLTLKNKGWSSLGGLAFTITGAGKGGYFIRCPGALRLDPGGDATVEISFRPDAEGELPALLEIASNDPDENPFSLMLQGSGLPAPSIVVSQESGSTLASGMGTVGFGTVATSRAVARMLTIRNDGKGTLRGIHITKAGAHVADFIVRNPGSRRLAPGAKTRFKVIFKPRAEGRRKASLKIASNDPGGSPFRIRLAGRGKVR